MNVREQQDAFEFFTQIADQVDEYLISRGKPKIFSEKFEGIFSDQKICQGCPHRYEREQSFIALNLTVKSNNLQESLDQFVKGELLEGDNAYFCEKCQEKRNTIKRMCIRKLPSTLVIQLKRFHYDWETNRAMKFDDFFQFPWTLEMGPYTVEGIQIAEKSLSKKRDLSSKVVSHLYDLVGITVHSGQANAGHYYSFIKDRRTDNNNTKRNNKWFKFNDTTVEEFEMTEETLKTECFGGEYKVKKSTSSSPNSSLPENRQRYWNAYMLFYEARSKTTANTNSGNSGGTGSTLSASAAMMNKSPRKSNSNSSFKAAPSPARNRSITVPSSSTFIARESFSQLTDLLEKGEQKGLFTARRMPSQIERGIQEENLKFLKNRDIYCDDYFKFVHQLVNQGGSVLDSVKLGVHFLFNSYLHLKRRQVQVMKDCVEVVERFINSSKEANLWLINYLATEALHSFRPFILECPIREVRVHFSRLVEKAVYQVAIHENGNTESDDINRILATCVSLIENDVANNCKESGQLFSLISKFAQMVN